MTESGSASKSIGDTAGSEYADLLRELSDQSRVINVSELLEPMFLFQVLRRKFATAGLECGASEFDTHYCPLSGRRYNLGVETGGLSPCDIGTSDCASVVMS